MTVSILPFGSAEQQASIVLRDKVLRKPLGLAFTAAELAEESDQVHIAALETDAVAGVLLLKPVSASVIKMRQVAVDEALQGKGIGRQMVLFSEAWCRENGFDAIELHARKTAVPFYLGLNYSLVEGEFDEVGIPHLKMFKKLV